MKFSYYLRDWGSFLVAWYSNLGHAPRYAELRLTYRCNFRCSMCGLWMKRSPYAKRFAKEMPISRIRTLIEELGQLGTDNLCLTGGEVTLRKNLCEIISMGTRAGIAVSLNTNGSMLSQSLVESLLDAGLGGLMCSLDGARPEVHDLMRGVAGSFWRVEAGLGNLFRIVGKRKVPFYIHINCVVTRINWRTLSELIEFHDKFPYNSIAFLPVSVDDAYDDWAVGNNGTLKLTSEEQRALEEEIVPILLREAQKRCIELVPPDLSPITGTNSEDEKLPICVVPWIHTVIAPDGSLYPCCYAVSEAFRLGSVANERFMEVWNGPAYIRFRAGCKKLDYPMCKKCYSGSFDYRGVNLFAMSRLNDLGGGGYERYSTCLDVRSSIIS